MPIVLKKFSQLSKNFSRVRRRDKHEYRDERRKLQGGRSGQKKDEAGLICDDPELTRGPQSLLRPDRQVEKWNR